MHVTARAVEGGGPAVHNLLGLAGVTLVEVAGMKDWVCYVRSQHVGLIRAELSDEDREAAAEWLMVEACREQSPRR